jgi:non-ribosomal peptide synthetase component F/thioesterase domain-containing protein
MPSSVHPAPPSMEARPPIAESGEVFVLPASLGQERFWGLDRLNPGNPTWNVPVRFRLQGTLNPAFVERGFNEIIRRHEALRTTFTLVDGQLAQVIATSVKIKVPVTDLRHLPKPERDAEVDRLSLKEARWRFDLTVGPLLRVSLLWVEDNEHVLLVAPHHSIIDYWSVGLVSNELGALYEAYSRGVDPALPELPIQYGDYAVWQREQAKGPVVQTELAYWKKQLENLPLLDFPTDRPRPAFPTYDATITSILLPVKLTDAIREIANREGATFFNTMLAALSIVLHQYTGQNDFGVATQAAGRTSVDLEPLIGLFINSVVLRMDLSGDPSFSQLVGRVQEVGLASIANQNLRFELLLRQLRPNDYPSHHTLFRVNFICQRDPVKPLEFAGIKLTVIPSKSQGALYDLNIFLVLRNEGWRLACEYNTDLYEANTITGLLDSYRKLLESVADNPNRLLSELPLPERAVPNNQSPPRSMTGSNSPSGATSAELSATGDTSTVAAVQPTTSDNTVFSDATSSEDHAAEPYVMPSSVAQQRFWVLEQIAPGNPALHMRACVRLTGALSHALLEKSLQLLVSRHEILRTTFERVNDQIIQVIAPNGKIPLPVSSLQDVAEADLDARLWESIRAEVRAPFDLLRGPMLRARLFRLRSQDHVLVITTHHILVDGWSQNVIQRDLWTIYEALLEERDPPLVPLAIQYGDFVHWQQEWLASDGAKEQLEFWKKQLAPPLSVVNISTDQPSGDRAAAETPMETLLLPEELTLSLKKLAQSQDVTMFMLMLTCFGALLNRYTGQEDILIGSPVANRKPETEPLIGPFSGPVTLRLNLSGNPTIREMLGRTRDVTFEALSHSDLPFEVLLEKLPVRAVGGRHPLSQIYFFYQTAFLQPRQLRDMAVTPLPDFGLGTHFELQMGLLERREGVRCQLEYNPDLFEPATIRRILRDYLKILDVLLENPENRVDELPVSLQRQSEADPATDLTHTDLTVPPDEVEKQLTTIWEEVLGVRSIGRRQNYFDLGGNSLLAVRLFAQIEKRLKVKLPLSTLFEAQTIYEFSRVLRHETTATGWSPLVEIQPGGSRPPFFCVHGGGGNVLIYRDLSRRLGPDQPFYGLQSQGLDGERPFLTRIEDMAALYVKEIKKVQPNGPYFLGGYCMGGTVAFEMAQQLRAQGEQVAMLALFDTINWSKLPTSSTWDKLRYQGQRVMFHARNFLLLSAKDEVKFLREKLKVLQARSNVWTGMLFGRLMRHRRGSKSEILLLAQIWEINDRASLNYAARPYPGVITDFRPMKQYAFYHVPDINWDRLSLQGQEVVTLPVYPAGMLLEPFVKHLAAALKVAIDKARQVTSPAHQDH